MTADIFKANDIRGIVGETLDEDIIYRVGRAIAAQATALGHSDIALGRDGRLSGPALSAAMADGLCAGRLRVSDVGCLPTPALYYAATCHANGCGVMITGSHNPKNYNGVKMMLGGETVQGKPLYERYQQVGGGSRTAGATIQPLDIRDAYIETIKKANLPAGSLAVIVDAGNGSAGEYAPALYEALGYAVTPLFCDIDGNFPNHHPDPAQLENTFDAKNVLEQTAAQVALLFDGDGDRLGVLVPGKPPIYADRLLMLYARDMLSRNPGGRVVFDVKSTAHLAPWIEQHGGIADMQATGHSFIKARMRETGALIGGEMSGHFYFAENWYGFDDALFAGARLLALLADDIDCLAEMPESVSSSELHIDMHGKDQHEFIAGLHRSSVFPNAQRVVTIDGLRVEYAGGFGLVRASNTTPSLVLRFEAETALLLADIQEEFRRVLLRADATLALPF